ncbi:hypothetical protein GJ496_006908 [Pomphorhynchus laevis]|nr:hypothetical protein GJ496_006908 [Pomphorhynchus laevis]
MILFPAELIHPLTRAQENGSLRRFVDSYELIILNASNLSYFESHDSDLTFKHTKLSSWIIILTVFIIAIIVFVIGLARRGFGSHKTIYLFSILNCIISVLKILALVFSLISTIKSYRSIKLIHTWNKQVVNNNIDTDLVNFNNHLNTFTTQLSKVVFVQQQWGLIVYCVSVGITLLCLVVLVIFLIKILSKTATAQRPFRNPAILIVCAVPLLVSYVTCSIIAMNAYYQIGAYYNRLCIPAYDENFVILGSTLSAAWQNLAGQVNYSLQNILPQLLDKNGSHRATFVEYRRMFCYRYMSRPIGVWCYALAGVLLFGILSILVWFLFEYRNPLAKQISSEAEFDEITDTRASFSEPYLQPRKLVRFKYYSTPNIYLDNYPNLLLKQQKPKRVKWNLGSISNMLNTRKRVKRSKESKSILVNLLQLPYYTSEKQQSPAKKPLKIESAQNLVSTHYTFQRRNKLETIPNDENSFELQPIITYGTRPSDYILKQSEKELRIPRDISKFATNAKFPERATLMNSIRRYKQKQNANKLIL